MTNEKTHKLFQDSNETISFSFAFVLGKPEEMKISVILFCLLMRKSTGNE